MFLRGLSEEDYWKTRILHGLDVSDCKIKLSEDDIIDLFIKTNPKIEIPKEFQNKEFMLKLMTRAPAAYHYLPRKFRADSDIINLFIDAWISHAISGYYELADINFKDLNFANFKKLVDINKIDVVLKPKDKFPNKEFKDYYFSKDFIDFRAVPAKLLDESDKEIIKNAVKNGRNIMFIPRKWRKLEFYKELYHLNEFVLSRLHGDNCISETNKEKMKKYIDNYATSQIKKSEDDCFETFKKQLINNRYINKDEFKANYKAFKNDIEFEILSEYITKNPEKLALIPVQDQTPKLIESYITGINAYYGVTANEWKDFLTIINPDLLTEELLIKIVSKNKKVYNLISRPTVTLKLVYESRTRQK